MAYVIVGAIQRYVGLAADTKPALAASQVGYEALELDTDTRYVWDGSTWQAQSTLGTVTVSGVATAVNQSTEQTLIGAVNETAPATDTASSGMNGRLQRIAQRITSFIALIPAALTGSGNFKTALQEAIPAGTNAIGKLAANDAVDIGDVTINNTAASAVAVEGKYSYGRATADTQIKGSAGFVHSVSVAALTALPTAGLLTVYDSLTESGTVVYAEWVFATVTGHTVVLDVSCATGIFVGFDGALANVQATVSYR